MPAGTQVHGKEVQLLNYGLIEKLIFIEKVLSYSINVLKVFCCNKTSGFGFSFFNELCTMVFQEEIYLISHKYLMFYKTP